MLELVMSSHKESVSDLFLIDWREGVGSTTTEVVSKTVFNVGGSGNIASDATLTKCFVVSAGGGMYQVGSVLGLIDFTLPSWELSIDVIPAAINNGGIVMSRAYNSTGAGGWYFGLKPGTQGLIEFYWVGSNGIWNVITSTQALVIGQLTTLRLVRTSTALTLYFGNQQQATSSVATFNNPNITLAVASFTDSVGGRGFNGKIGKIRFFVPKP